MANLKKHLIYFVSYESKFLQDYTPSYFEYDLDKSAVKYAGFNFIGSVDRVDIDSNNNASIVDYKGSINSNYLLYIKSNSKLSRAHPLKIQTLVYAKMINNVLGLNINSCLYISYGKNKAVSGVCNSDINIHPDVNLESLSFSEEKMETIMLNLLPEDFDIQKDFKRPNNVSEIDRLLLWVYSWFCEKKTSKNRDFMFLLDVVETYCSFFVDFWKKKDFSCNPSSESSCLYCPAKDFCKGRL